MAGFSKFIPHMSNTRTPPEQLLTEREAAPLLGVEAETLQKWRATGRHGLPFVKLGRKIVRYRPSDITKFIERNTVKPQLATA
jgi:excisionase family DNA binding protein